MRVAPNGNGAITFWSDSARTRSGRAAVTKRQAGPSLRRCIGLVPVQEIISEPTLAARRFAIHFELDRFARFEKVVAHFDGQRATAVLGAVLHHGVAHAHAVVGALPELVH